MISISCGLPHWPNQRMKTLDNEATTLPAKGCEQNVCLEHWVIYLVMVPWIIHKGSYSSAQVLMTPFRKQHSMFTTSHCHETPVPSFHGSQYGLVINHSTLHKALLNHLRPNLIPPTPWGPQPASLLLLLGEYDVVHLMLALISNLRVVPFAPVHVHSSLHPHGDPCKPFP